MTTNKIMKNQFLLTWQRNTDINDELIYKKAGVNQACFVRDSIGCLLRTPVFIASTHYSKSVKLPVYKFVLRNGITVYCRENFYGWVISVISPLPMTFSKDMIECIDDITENIHPCYCEGFDKSWCFGHYSEGCTECTFRINSNYDFYTFLFLLKHLDGKLDISKYLNADKDTLIERCLEITSNNMCKNNRNNYGGPDEEYFESLSIFDIFRYTLYLSESTDFMKAHNLDYYKYEFSDDENAKYTEFIDRVLSYPDELLESLATELTLIDLGEE